jgi:hypothetical protein
MPVLIGPEEPVNSYTTNNQQNPSITALADGGWVVTWESFGQDTADPNDPQSRGVYQQRFSNTGALVGAETRINAGSGLGDQWLADVDALDGG